MEYTGLIRKYPCNRPLTELERAHQLKQNVRLPLHPHYQLSVIAMNSTYLESVDKWFAWKGVITLVATSMLVLFSWIFGGMAAQSLLEASNVRPSTDEVSILWLDGLAALLVCSVLAWAAIWLLRKESFAYTHYPMRFNRKNRMVHVFQTDGTTLSVPWDDIFFTLGKMASEWEVRGHVLDGDRTTVRATFALSCVRVLNDYDTNPNTRKFSDQDFVRGHWEFIRRYMEDGPQTLTSQVEFCMPLDGRRETAMGGVHRILANFAGGSLPLLLVAFPFCAITSMFRIVAMRTSKIPQWPKDVEDACKIEPGDPFAIRGDDAGNRVPVFPEAATAAGVRFIGQAPGSGT